MKTSKQFADIVTKKYKKAKKKNNIKRTVVSLMCSGIFIFLVLFSNIIPFNVSIYSQSYKKYLKNYISESGEYALRFINSKNAALVINNQPYVCSLSTKSASNFNLMTENFEEDTEKENYQFNVKFTGEKATVTGETQDGKKINEILSATDDIWIESGLWQIFGIKTSEETEIDTSVSGAGWIMVLENGDTYTGEGINSVYPSYFVSVGDRILHCIQDAESGDILDASIFKYEANGEFDYPVLKERYLSDYDYYEYCYKIIDDNNLFDYNGGTLTADIISNETQNNIIEKEEIFDITSVKWRLFPRFNKEFSFMNLKATLVMNENGSARFKISGNLKYNTNINGKWYRLKDGILIILDKDCNFTGKAFTVFNGSDQTEYFGNDNSFESSAVTTLYLNSFYKVGYHEFFYFYFYRETKIFWGSEWEKDNFKKELVYNKPYVLDGKYCQEYYESEDYPFCECLDYAPLTDLPKNGRLYLIFRENTLCEVYLDDILINKVRFKIGGESHRYIDFYKNIDVGLKINSLNISANSLYMAGANSNFDLYNVIFKLKKD